MRKKALILCAVGFLMGEAAMFIVPAILNGGFISGGLYSHELLEKTGSPAWATLLTLLVMGLYGILCVGGTIFYDIERWPLALSTAAHYFSMSLGYLLPNRLLCWNMPTGLLLRIEGVMTVSFFLIWLFMYLFFKRQVRELNRLTEKKKQNSKEEERS